MSKNAAKWAVALCGLALAAPTLADDLAGSDDFLCSAVHATDCLAEGDCTSGSPWSWNIPQFLEVDLSEKVLRTTAASGENRSTPIMHLERGEGQIYVQGIQGGRAFSMVITEETGIASIGVAFEGRVLAVFAACTPTATSD